MSIYRKINNALKENKIKWLKRKMILFSYKRQYEHLIEYAELYGSCRAYGYLTYQDELIPVLGKLGYKLENNFFIKEQ